MANKFLNVIGRVFGKKGQTVDLTRIEGIDFINNGGNPETFKELQKTLLILPNGVLNFMRERKLSIVYYNQDDFFKLGDFTSSGLYYHGTNRIFVHDDGHNLEWQKCTLIHEIGHFIDYHLESDKAKWLSFSAMDLQKSAAEAEVHYNIKYGENSSEYWCSNIKEIFAQGFAEFMLDRKNFVRKCKNQTVFFETILAKIEFRYNF